MLNLYRALLALRRREPALSVGDYGRIEAHGDVLLYERTYESRRLLICLNMAGRAMQAVALPAAADVYFPPIQAGSPAGHARTLRLEGGRRIVLAVS